MAVACDVLMTSEVLSECDLKIWWEHKASLKHIWAPQSSDLDLGNSLCLMNMQKRRPTRFPPSNLGAQIAEQIARTRKLASQSIELLKEPPPDTFLGRRHQDPVPLPNERKSEFRAES